jgi:WD40 repeat protein
VPESPVYRVDASGAHAVQVGDGIIQHNYFHLTFTDPVAPKPLKGKSRKIESPYRGLQAFGEADADFFFGRARAILDIRERLAACAHDDGLLVVSGVSGAGKTSLLRAGLLPELRRAGLPAATGWPEAAALPAAAGWPGAALIPGDRPLDSLAVAIAPAAKLDAAEVRRSLAADPAGFRLTARQAAGEGRMLLIVDQFETLFTQCEREAERQGFIKALCSATAAGAAVVVVAIRADLEARLAEYPGLDRAVQHHRYLLTSMTERQLREAITGPAIRVESSVDEDLVEQLLRELRTPASRPGGGPQPIGAGMLPLLSHALDQAWRLRDDQSPAEAWNRPLTLADYDRTGGIEHAIATSAETVYRNELTRAQRAIARQVFIRLTASTPDGIDTAVRVARADLLAGQGEPAAADVDRVLTAFADARLLALASDTVEISHEALLSAWPLLRDDWLAGTHADRAVRARLQATLTDWNEAGRDPSFLYSGSQLDAAEQAAARIAADGRHPPLAEGENAFLRQSRLAARRAARLRRRTVAGVGVLAVALAVALVIASVSAGHLLTERNRAVAAQQSAAAERDAFRNELAAQTATLLASESLPLGSTDPMAAAEDSVLAWGLNRSSAQARDALLTAAANPLVAVNTDLSAPLYLGFSANSKTLLIQGTGDTSNSFDAEQWNVVTGEPDGLPVSTGGAEGFTAGLVPGLETPAISPDGQTVAFFAYDGGNAVALWNMTTGATSNFDVGPDQDEIRSAAFSPDGQALALEGWLCGGGKRECAYLWTASQGLVGAPLDAGVESPLTPGTPLVVFSRDGRQIATADTDNVVRVWDVATHRQEGRAFPPLRSAIDSIAFSPDGHTLAVGEDDGTIQFLNMTAGPTAGPVLRVAAGGAGAAVSAIAYSPDGSLLAAGDQNGTTRIWSLTSGRQLDLSSGTAPVTSAAFSPDGRTLAIAGSAVRLWSTAALDDVLGQPPVSGGVGGAALAANHTLVADAAYPRQLTDGDNIGIRVWYPGDRHGPDISIPFPNPQTPLAFPPIALSPDGKTLITGSVDGTVRLWRVPLGLADNRPELSIPVPQAASGANVSALAFNGGGTRIAAGYFDGQVFVFDSATGESLGEISQDIAFPGETGIASGALLAVGFTPDGNVITVTLAGQVAVWSLPQQDQVQPPVSVPIGGQATAAAVSPDGRTLAVGNNNGTIQFWSVPTGRQVGPSIATGDGAIDSLAFSPDGTTLASAGADGTLRTWNVGYLTPAAALARLCGRIRPAMSAAAWSAPAEQKAGLSFQEACSG